MNQQFSFCANEHRGEPPDRPRRADGRRQRIVAQTSSLLYRGFSTRLRRGLPTPWVSRTTCRLEVGDTAGWKPALRELSARRKAFKIRNPNLEIRNKVPSRKARNRSNPHALAFRGSEFGFVSDLGFRVSDFRSGFSLIEVLCAILILGIGIAGLTHGLDTALGSSKESELQTTAALLAAGRIETLRAEGLITDGVEEGDAGNSFPLYRWQQTITRSDIEGLHEVKVVIEEAKSGKPIYELRTLLFDPPYSLSASTSANQRDKGESRRKERRRR